MSCLVDNAKPDSLERAAYHEAGHAAIWRHFGRPFSFVLITEDGNGLTSITRSVQFVGPPQPPRAIPVDHAQLVAVMAGRAAEAIRYPDLLRDELERLSSSDERRARGLIREFYGSDISEDQVDTRLVELEAEATQILQGEWMAVEALAAALIAHPNHDLDGDDALRVMNAAAASTRHLARGPAARPRCIPRQD
jgi:hypothetical protein